MKYFQSIQSILVWILQTLPHCWGGGTWTRIAQGRTLVGLDENDNDFKTVGNTGGEKTHKLTVDEMPSHHHFIGGYSNDSGSKYYYIFKSSNTSYGSKNTSDVGGDQAHNNLQPYLVTYIWRRTA